MENTTGGYGDEGVLWHQHSNRLMKKILELWPDKSIPVIDLGCGHNWYVSVLKHYGYRFALGVDLVDLGSKFFEVGDVTKPMVGFKPLHNPDSVNVLSLEVGEHIPEELASAYLDNLTRFNGHIIMSWAIPGQDGIGHINCQPNEWVINEMAKRGYTLQENLTSELRSHVSYCHCNWFKNTLMYFTKF